MMHIFIFNNASRAANYGIGTYVRLLADGLLGRSGVKVSFVDMFSDVKEYSIAEDERGCRHYKVPALFSGMENEAYCRNVFYFLARHIKAEDDERLVFHFNYFQHKPLASLLKGQYFDCRIIFTVHYLGWCFELKGNKTRFRELIAEEYQPKDDKERGLLAGVENEKEFLHLADEVIVLSKDTQQILAEGYGVSSDKMHLVYNGLGDGLCFDKDKNVGNGRMILFVGRLDEIKGLNYLIHAFRHIADKYPDTRLVVAGDGDFQLYLSQCRDLQGRVSFLGKVSSSEVEDVYRSAYIGVMPSFHEQCSYTAIEMMRHKIPLVGTDTTGLAEMLDATPELRVSIDEDNMMEEEFTGRLVSCLDLLLSDVEAYQRAADAVGKLYEARYKVSDMVHATCCVMESSWDRPDYTVSPDYLKHIDSRMIQLINQCPDIDTDFYGMGGIGVYLWKRVLDLCDRKEEDFQVSLILEHLIYYMDWVQDVAGSGSLPVELWAMIRSMGQHGFYKTCVDTLLMRQPGPDALFQMPSDRVIIQNALKICNCKI